MAIDLPTTADVARVMRSRMFDDTSQVVSDFSDDTAVTNADVVQFIEDAADDIVPKVGVTLPDGPADDVDLYRRSRKKLIARRAALDVELALQAEQADPDDGYYNRQLERLDASIKTLVDAVQDATEGGDPGEVDDRPTAVGTFPDPAVRWDCEAF